MALEHLRIAWKAFRKNWKPLVGGSFILIALLMAFMVIGAMIIAVPAIAYSQGAISMAAMLGLVLIGLVIMAAGMLVYSVLLGGYLQVCADSLKKTAAIKSMFDTARSRWKSILGVNILVFFLALLVFSIPVALMVYAMIMEDTMLMMFSFVLMLVAFLIQIMFNFSIISVIVDRAKAWQGVKNSFNFVKSNYLQTLFLLFVLMIVIMPISVIFAFVPLGSLVVNVLLVPFTYLVYISFYISKLRSHKNRR